ncbi:hypothetical protein CKY10_21805 [Photorhabdus sp. HUG-39]|uniref:Uncharacterized protein n=1 Tax=Photorhabdus kayaii TaxID=230088 RepID=A0ABX0B9H4_9GAMM|nr:MULTISPECIES: hypothetical protein [Photorhabdus]MCC8375583.1 hypothetical protein [Photorhabdus bodei]NDL14297.1 hypothetical protein [Photorhabdus kayaii]NDL27824.1 hypothetical protein [Photorhabdus kayaii]RAX06662.1 hypothetical protein CKY10_21805 [Photorhabdus sp. HUG-39]
MKEECKVEATVEVEVEVEVNAESVVETEIDFKIAYAIDNIEGSSCEILGQLLDLRNNERDVDKVNLYIEAINKYYSALEFALAAIRA